MKDYARLPKHIYHEDTRRCLLEFLFDFQNEDFCTTEHALVQLLEISRRNSHCYLDEALQSSLSNIILNVFSSAETYNAAIVSEIAQNLGLFDIWDEVFKAYAKKNPDDSTELEKLTAQCNKTQALFLANSWHNKKLFELRKDHQFIKIFEASVLYGAMLERAYNSYEQVVCASPGNVCFKHDLRSNRLNMGYLFITTKRLLWLPRYKSKIGLIQEGFDVEFTQIKTFAIQKSGSFRSSMSLFLVNDDCLEIFPRYSKAFNTELSERLLNNHRYLPDGLTIEQTRQYFIEFLFDHQDVKLGEELSTFEQMCEIAERETYDVLDKTLLAKIAEFVLKYLDYEDFELMDVATTIIVRQGITEAWQAVLEKKDAICNLEVVKLINEINEECGDHIDDPYWSCKQLDKSD